MPCSGDRRLQETRRSATLKQGITGLEAGIWIAELDD
jgi:hypothetical protein